MNKLIRNIIVALLIAAVIISGVFLFNSVSDGSSDNVQLVVENRSLSSVLGKGINSSIPPPEIPN